MSDFRFLVISDTHFGFGRGTEREEDCWTTVEEAIDRAPELGVDFILIPGDMFDIKVPKPDDWSRALKLFSKSKIPIYAIHGNHEKRGQNLTNPVEGMAKGGVLTYIDRRSEEFEINGRKIAIYGLGWVPEAYSKQMFEENDPKSVDNAYNIFVIHQSISPYIFNPMDPPSIDLQDLPKGFDLYINGHIHSFSQSEVHGKPFFIPGSSVTTQVNMLESKKEKGFVIVSVTGNKTVIEYVPFKTARRIFYKELQIEGERPSEIQEKIKKFLDSIPLQEKKTLVRVKVKGNLPKGLSVRDLNLREIRNQYLDKMMLSLGAKVTEEEFEERKRVLENIRDQKISIDEMGMKMLREIMNEMGSDFKFEHIFEYLVDGDIDSTVTILTSD